jgi:hypothetical protein
MNLEIYDGDNAKNTDGLHLKYTKEINQLSDVGPLREIRHVSN